jgi:hypothetical protein
MAVVGFVAAAVVGWNLAGPANIADGKSSAPANARSSSGRVRPALESSPPAWAHGNLAAIQHAASPVERMRAIISLAQSVPLAEIPKWLDGGWFRPGEGFDSTFFNELLLHRWEQAEPLAMAQWRMRKNPPEAQSVLMRLAETDPEKVISLLKERPSGWIEIEVLAEMTKFHPELAMDRFMELALGGMGMGEEESNAASFLDALAKNNPELLEAQLDQLTAYWSTRAKDALVGQRLIASFDVEIRKLWNEPDGWMRFANNISREGMVDKLLGELANLPSSWRQSLSASDWMIWQNREKWWNADLEGGGFTPEQAKKIRMTALARMTNDHPETAIQWLDAIELSAKERSAMIEKIFQWGSRTPEESAGLMQRLTTGEDRRAAQAMLDRRAANEETVIPPVSNPGEWLEKFGTAEPRSDESRQYRNMLRTWEPAKLNELAARLRDLPDESRIKVATTLTERECDYSQISLHGEALRCLAEHPAAHPKIIQKTSLHAVKWALKNPAAASSWVGSLPAGAARQWAQNNLAACWAHYDLDASEQWLNSLPEPEQFQIRDFLRNTPGSPGL